jgi:peroxiredoxin
MYKLRLSVVLLLISGALSASPRLPVPELGDDLLLPGINKGMETFALEDIKSPALVLLVYDLYCPACQKSARNMKYMAEKINDAFPAIPTLGVGSGDTPFEAKAFKSKFKLPFPCISDREKSVAEHYEVKKTPSVIVLMRKGEGDPFTEVYRHEGYLGHEHVEQVLDALEEKL